MSNIFETLLTSIDETDRATLKEIAERNPKLTEYIADPKDVSQVERIRTWTAENWDFEHNSTKNEYARKLRIEALEAQIAAMPAAGEEMNLEQLNAYLEDRIKDGKVVSAATMKEEINGIIKTKEEEMSAYVNRVAALATTVPYLNQIHQRDLGEMFDPDDLLTKANEAKATDLKDFYYKSYSADKRAAKETERKAAEQADIDKRIADATEAGRRAALQEAAGRSGAQPSLDNGPDLGHFQARIQGRATIPAPAAGETKTDLEKVPFGNGSIAAIRAREGDRREIQGHAA